MLPTLEKVGNDPRQKAPCLEGEREERREEREEAEEEEEGKEEKEPQVRKLKQ